MVGGGCRGLEAARDLVAEGHAVRAVTPPGAGAGRTSRRRGAECFTGDPDVVGTLRYALDNVTAGCSARRQVPAEKVAALHGSRLRMMLDKTTDTTVRGVVDQAARPVGTDVLATGVEEVRARAADERDPLRAARDGGHDGALGPRRPGRDLLRAHRAPQRSGLTASDRARGGRIGSRRDAPRHCGRHPRRRPGDR